ncbi:hypothetical protein AGIG_G24183 [Arapaima gigas]
MKCPALAEEGAGNGVISEPNLVCGVDVSDGGQKRTIFCVIDTKVCAKSTDLPTILCTAAWHQDCLRFDLLFAVKDWLASVAAEGDSSGQIPPPCHQGNCGPPVLLRYFPWRKESCSSLLYGYWVPTVGRLTGVPSTRRLGQAPGECVSERLLPPASVTVCVP